METGSCVRIGLSDVRRPSINIRFEARISAMLVRASTFYTPLESETQEEIGNFYRIEVGLTSGLAVDVFHGQGVVVFLRDLDYFEGFFGSWPGRSGRLPDAQCVDILTQQLRKFRPAQPQLFTKPPDRIIMRWCGVRPSVRPKWLNLHRFSAYGSFSLIDEILPLSVDFVEAPRIIRILPGR